MNTNSMTGLKRAVQLAAAVAFGLGLGGGAQARTVENGLSFNGLSFNGLSFNGLSFNGRDTSIGSIRIESTVLPDGTSIPLR